MLGADRNPPTQELMDDRARFEEFARLATEQRNPRTMDLDVLEIPELLARINAEDRTVPEAVARELPQIARAVEFIVASFKAGGRLIYVGAGTSGRLGVLDASECPPTFGSDPDMVVGVIAGGYTAVVRAVEGAEDRADQGAHAMDDLEVGPEDTVVGLAASRRTPYVVSAIARARSLGSRTVYVTCTPREEFTLEVDVAICPVVGPEVLMGSTRMKAGTAQKLVCNMLSTASFLRVGKAYENMMVDLLANSQKLVERGRRTVMTATGCDYKAASQAIEAAGKSIKTAIVMVKLGCSRSEAEQRLAAADGFVRGALGEQAAGGQGP
jgi:N-acetylmuramic acid 6-phosphate etherase